MTQKIFDTDNAEDMALLWNILPDRINNIKRVKNERYCDFVTEVTIGNDGSLLPQELIAINWHDKTKITRPIQEATEQDIGKICYFWSDDNPNDKAYGILSSIGTENGEKYYTIDDACFYEHARRLTKQEIEELC